MAIKKTPSEIFKELEDGRSFKSGLGENGLYEQNRINERFYAGDQWRGANVGNRPLVRHNVIKRIGEYKMSVIGSNPLSANFSAEGVPSTVSMKNRAKEQRAALIAAQETNTEPSIEKNAVHLVMAAMSDYFKTTAERVKFEHHKLMVLRDAYISGTGFLYTHWNPDLMTGLYADRSEQTPIKGDIEVETLDVENVYFGDPNVADVQKQPYILIVQRKRVGDVQAMAKRYGDKEATIVPDDETSYMAGDRSARELKSSKKVTVVTKMFKEIDDNGDICIKAISVTKNAVVRKEWNLRVRLYPLAMFQWEYRKNCAYGDSEITHLIPNQIAINRMITASVWAVMMMGIPITVVNGDVVQDPITNDPGQVLRVFGSAEDVNSAVRYVNPPQFSPKFDQNIQSLIANTLSQSGANDAALGNMRPDNTSAIVAVREAATMPMQPIQNRFYAFVEDVARIWAEFWVAFYGKRNLKIEDENGTWYMPFDGDEYRRKMITARVDVGASGLWSEVQLISTLDNLLAAQIITPLQYLDRLPRGLIPDQTRLIDELKAKTEAPANQGVPETPAAVSAAMPMQEGADETGVLSALPEEYRQVLAAMPPDEAKALIQRAMQSQ